MGKDFTLPRAQTDFGAGGAFGIFREDEKRLGLKVDYITHLARIKVTRTVLS
jgi:hypothetical protein